ncbi:MAG TPA: Rieske (2Fe-2S) protein [Prosthecobacter sp.]
MLRRTWLQGWLVGSVRVLAGAGASGLLLTRVSPAMQTGPGALFLSLTDFPALQNEGGSVLVQLSAVEAPLVVSRLPGDAFTALDSTCTHDGCTVNTYDKLQACIECPCHGSQFDIHGHVLAGPAEEDLTSFPVTFDGAGEVKILLPNLPVDARPIFVHRKLGGSMRMKLTLEVKKGHRYRLRFQRDVTRPFEPVLFAVTPFGKADKSEMRASGDGSRHLYADVVTSRGFFEVVEES